MVNERLPLPRHRLRNVFGLAERAEAELIRTVMGWNLAGGWDADGQRSAICWLTWQLNLSRPRAKILVDCATLCDHFPAVAAALTAGQIACGHVAAMARAEARCPDELAICAEGLLGAAQRTTVHEFDWVASQWASAVDQGKKPTERDRGLSISNTIGGKGFVHGEGSTEEAEILRRALLKDNPPDAADCAEGPRTQAQRMWDRLIDLARRELAGEDPTGPADGLDLVADAEAVARALADEHADGPEHARIEAPAPALDLEDAPGDEPSPIEDVLAPHIGEATNRANADLTVPQVGIMGGPPLPPTTISRMLCTAWIRRVLRDPRTGHILDFGRRHRLYNRNQRRALAHRDGGCGFPGCDLGPRYCDAHHILPWPDGGLTNLDEGLLLCRRHHVIVHTKGWTLGRDPTTGIVTVTTPDGRTFRERPTAIGRRL